MTIARVAAEAGVGVGTVSRVLNGSPSVSEDTRRRVLEAIATLDYQPSAVARALSTGRTHAVGVVAPFFTRPSVIERLRGVSRTLAGEDYQLILFDVERAAQRREAFRSLAVRGRIDGILSVSLSPTEREAARLESTGVPIVLLDRDHPTLPALSIDDTEGGAMAARHLIELGHERLAFLGDEEGNEFGFDSSAHRREGFAAEVVAAGLAIPP
jgi:DNA-binding LacI/PurR family transcriptional regulator